LNAEATVFLAFHNFTLPVDWGRDVLGMELSSLEADFKIHLTVKNYPTSE
jgi:hypothetical protein